MIYQWRWPKKNFHFQPSDQNDVFSKLLIVIDHFNFFMSIIIHKFSGHDVQQVIQSQLNQMNHWSVTFILFFAVCYHCWTAINDRDYSNRPENYKNYWSKSRMVWLNDTWLYFILCYIRCTYPKGCNNKNAISLWRIFSYHLKQYNIVFYIPMVHLHKYIDGVGLV